MTTPTPTRFEERLLEQLKQVVEQNPAPAASAPAAASRARNPRRRVALSGAGLTAAVAATAAVVIATSGGVASPAFAVQARSNGTVSVSIKDLRDAAELERKLRAAGIPAIVDYVADPKRCGGPGVAGPGASGPQTGVVRSHEAGDDGPSLVASGGHGGNGGDPKHLSTHGGPPPGGGAVGMSTRVAADGSATFTVDPDDIRAGDTLMIAATTGEFSSLGMAIVSDTKHAPALPCVPGQPG